MCIRDRLMGWCGILCLVGNAALADEAAQVGTISPIIRDVVEKNVECKDEKTAYALRVRLATPVSYTHLDVYKRQDACTAWLLATTTRS